MRYSLTGAAAALLMASVAPALAQSPPPPPMMMAPGGVNWTGLYLGVNLGGGWGESRFNFAPAGTATNNFNVKGPFGGGTLGFNWQLSPAWVIGIEGDIDGTGLGGNSVCPGGGGPTNAATCRTSETFAGTALGRIGWAPGSG